MKLTLPELSLVLLVAPSGAGKSTFAAQHFKRTEVISSDYCRGLVSDDENDQTVSGEAFELLHYIVAKRLARGRLTVVDATNVQPEARKPLLALAKQYHVLAVAIVFDLPEALCVARNKQRPDRDFGPHVIRRQAQGLRRSLRGLRGEGFHAVFTFHSPEEVDAATIEREPLLVDKRHEHGPFDVIGDIHGCFDELMELVGKLGYQVEELPSPQPSPQRGEGVREMLGAPPPVPQGDGPHPIPLPEREGTSVGTGEAPGPPSGGGFRGTAPEETTPPPLSGEGAGGRGHFRITHPEGRKLVLLGDLVDRGPKIPEVLRFAMDLVGSGAGFCVMGNHENKLLRKLNGRNVQITHGLAETLQQLEAEPPEFTQQVKEFLDELLSHYALDDGRLVVAHAGLKQEMHGRASGEVRSFALYGETTGETDEFGLPVRGDWAARYRGAAAVVYGHTPVAQPEWLNKTMNVDTGCVFGGQLTALRYPEKTLVSVPAAQVYYEPARPLATESPDSAAPVLTQQQQHDDLLNIEEVLGKRVIQTRLAPNITIREENAIAALEVMSRFAVNPKWLVYLPPTMSPSETSRQPGLLEHPAEALHYYASQEVERVVCEEKHMGSRAVVIVCRDEEVARARFGVVDEGFGICYTRTGRRFFENPRVELELLSQVRTALNRIDLWSRLKTDWVLLDCELMPWSAKAQGLLRGQYAPVGAAARAATAETIGVLKTAAAAGVEVSPLLDHFRQRADSIDRYVDAYSAYCWNVDSVADLKLAPFHLLASEGAVHADHDHVWHMQTLTELCQAGDGLLLATPYQVVELADEKNREQAVRWWEELTGRHGEGMVVKPIDFVARGPRGLAQPAVKCRGQEYLRIIYGPEYTAPEHLVRLRQRGLSTKRSLAIREFALGLEALERFVQREPLYRIHECVFGILALESEPVDPRL